MELQIAVYANLIPLITLFVMLLFLMLNPLFEQQQRKLFLIAFILNIVMVFAATANYFMVPWREGDIWIFRRLTTFINFAVSPAIPFILLLIFQRKKLKLFYALPLIINAILCTVSLFAKVVFYIDKGNYYSRGPLFFFSFLVAVTYMILLIAKPSAHHTQSRIRERAFLICVTVILALCMYLEIRFGYFFLSGIATTNCLVLYYLLLVIGNFTVDPLTGAYSRIVYLRELSMLRSKTFSIAMIDLNNFKHINDTFGHDKGDECLIEVVDVFQKFLPNGASIYRIGGDEFVLIAKHTTSIQLYEILNKVNANLTTVKFAYGMETHIAGTNTNDTLKKIDVLMYENKKLFKDEIRGEKQNG